MSIIVTGESFGSARIDHAEPGRISIYIGSRKINGSLIMVKGTASTKLGGSDWSDHGQFNPTFRYVHSDCYRCDMQGFRAYRNPEDYRSDRVTQRQYEKAEQMLRDAADQLQPDQIAALEAEHDAMIRGWLVDSKEALTIACRNLAAYLSARTVEELADTSDRELFRWVSRLYDGLGELKRNHSRYHSLREYRRQEQAEKKTGNQ